MISVGCVKGRKGFLVHLSLLNMSSLFSIPESLFDSGGYSNAVKCAKCTTVVGRTVCCVMQKQSAHLPGNISEQFICQPAATATATVEK